MSTDIVKPNGKEQDPVKALSQYLSARQGLLAKYAASRTKPETLIRLATFEFQRTKGLRECRIESIYTSLILAAQIGLEPSGIRGDAYLVPFKGECTLIPGWRGLIKLARRSTVVKSFYAHIVYEGDEFDVTLGTDVKIHHKPILRQSQGVRGDIIAAYAVAKFADGECDVEVIPVSDLEYIKSKSAGRSNPAYGDWEDQMFRKAPIRRLAKRLPLGDDFFLASKADEVSETEGGQASLVQFIDAEATEVKDGGPSLQDSIADKLSEKAAQARGEKDAR
jgi:recombination protein RecT